MSLRFLYLIGTLWALVLPKGYAQQTTNKADHLTTVDVLIEEGQYKNAVDYIDSLIATDDLQGSSKLKNELIAKKGDAYYYLNELETSFEYYLFAAKSEELQPENNKKFIGDAYANAAYCLTELGLHEKALSYDKLAYNYAKLINDSAQMAVTTANIAINYKHQGNYDLSLKHFEEAYAIDKNLKDSIGIAYDLNALAVHFKEWKKYDQALAYFEESLAIMKKAGLKKEMSTRYSNISQVYLAIDNIVEAERNISKAIAIDKELKDSLNLAKHIDLLGLIFDSKGDYAIAMDYHMQALNMFQQFNTQSHIAISHRLIAQTYLNLNQPNKAIEHLNKGIELASSNQFLRELMNLFKLKETCLNMMGDASNAKLYQEQYHIIKDSIYSINNSNRLQKIELEIELSKKEAEIENQRELATASLTQLEANNKQFIIWLITGFAFVAFLILYLFISRQSKNEALYELEIAKLQSKLQALIKNDPESFNIKIKDINGQLDDPLSEKEFDVVKFIFTKKSNVEIGSELDLSVNTIKYHFKNIYKKFGVSNRKEALQFLLAPA